MGNAGRAQGEFPTANHGLPNGNGEEKIGLANVVMVEKNYHVGAKVVGVENPPAVGNRDPKLMFLVAFPVERDESHSVRVGELQQRPGSGNKGRGLILRPMKGG